MAPDKANSGAIPRLSQTGLLSKIVPTAHLVSGVHVWRHRERREAAGVWRKGSAGRSPGPFFSRTGSRVNRGRDASGALSHVFAG